MNPWVIGGAVVGLLAITALVVRKQTLTNTGPSYLPPGTTDAPATGGVTPSNQTPATANTGPVGKKAYVGKAGLITRSSPELNDGFLGMFSNDAGAVNGVGTWLGVVQSTAADLDKDKNPATGTPYIWYKLNVNPALLLLPSNDYYAREDYVNLK